MAVDEEGIYDFSSATFLGLLAWEDIRNIRIQKVMNQKYIAVSLYNTDSYLQKAGAWQREAYKQMGYNAIFITLHSSSIKPEDILPNILEWKDYVDNKK